MGKPAAVGPKLTLAELIDRRLGVEQQMKALEVLKSQLAEQMVAAMKHHPETKAYGKTGKGYQLIAALKCVYAAEATAYVKHANLAHLFTREPEITRAKVLDALKKDLLTQTQYAALQGFEGPTFTQYTLKACEAPKTDV